MLLKRRLAERAVSEPAEPEGRDYESCHPELRIKPAALTQRDAHFSSLVSNTIIALLSTVQSRFEVKYLPDLAKLAVTLSK